MRTKEGRAYGNLSTQGVSAGVVARGNTPGAFAISGRGNGRSLPPAHPSFSHRLTFSPVVPTLSHFPTLSLFQMIWGRNARA